MTDVPAALEGPSEGQQRQADTKTAVETIASTVRLPPFWEEDPVLWFIQVEAVFAAHRITSAKHRSNLVISQLPYKNLAQIADLAKTPTDTPYQSIKDRLIGAYSQSQERRVLRLLEETQLGDNRPSQLLRHMQAVSDGSLSEQVLKTVWLRALPNRTRNILTALEQPLNQLAIIADKILDNDPNEVAVVNPNPREDMLKQLIAEVGNLKLALEKNRSRSRSRSKARSQKSSKGMKQPQKENWLCYYHFKFKEKARKCEQPCNWSSHSQPLN